MNGRSNGLSAQRYTPLVDLEPQFADALLEALRDEGVAAYASPAPGVRGPYMDIVLPNTPTDRVWVDAEATTQARDVLDARRAEFDAGSGEPTPVTEVPDVREPAQAPDADIDAAWRAIVAGYGRTGTDPVARWSATEDVDEAPEEPAGRRGESRRILHRPEAEADTGWGEPGEATTPAEPAEEPEEHYVPPPPPPLPRMDANTRFAWIGVLGGPLFLILLTSLDWQPFEGATFVAIAAFVGGFVTLIYRMKDEDRDTGGDDGAVV